MGRYQNFLPDSHFSVLFHVPWKKIPILEHFQTCLLIAVKRNICPDAFGGWGLSWRTLFLSALNLKTFGMARTLSTSLVCRRVGSCVKKEEFYFWRRSLTQWGFLLFWTQSKQLSCTWLFKNHLGQRVSQEAVHRSKIYLQNATMLTVSIA